MPIIIITTIIVIIKYIQLNERKLGVVAPTCNPSTQETEAWVEGHPENTYQGPHLSQKVKCDHDQVTKVSISTLFL